MSLSRPTQPAFVAQLPDGLVPDLLGIGDQSGDLALANAEESEPEDSGDAVETWGV